MGAYTPFASVIICTRNRSTFLGEVCREVVGIDYPERAWELLIIDNGSTDDTLEVAQKFAAAHPGLVRVCALPSLGL